MFGFKLPPKPIYTYSMWDEKISSDITMDEIINRFINHPTIRASRPYTNRGGLEIQFGLISEMGFTRGYESVIYYAVFYNQNDQGNAKMISFNVRDKYGKHTRLSHD